MHQVSLHFLLNFVDAKFFQPKIYSFCKNEEHSNDTIKITRFINQTDFKVRQKTNL